MIVPDLTVVRDDTAWDALTGVAVAQTWLRRIVRDGSGPVLRLYRPASVLAFSGRDCLMPGIGEAARAARAHGFTPVRRGPGGHATAYDNACLGVDLISPGVLEPDSINRRFSEFGELFAGVLRAVGMPGAAVGEVPGEYCPGEYSVHDGAGHKIVGTAQRLIPGGWLFASMIVVDGSARLAGVMEPVYQALGLDLDPRTVGAVRDRAPVSFEDLTDAVVAAHTGGDSYRVGQVPADLAAELAAGTDRFRVRGDTGAFDD